MAQLANVPPQLAQKLDNTETASALRELFLIKRTYDIEKKTNPDNNYYPGKLVFYKDDDYRVVASDDSRVVLVNDRGKVHKVSKTDLNDTYANRSTPGQTDNYFVKDSHSDFSAGTWVWVEARPEMTKRYQADYELAMFVMENQGQALIFFALDGMVDARPIGDIVAATKDDQVVFNSDKKLFLFREFALRGDQTKAATHSPNKGLHAYIRRGKLTKSTTRFKVEPSYDYAEKAEELEPAARVRISLESSFDNRFRYPMTPTPVNIVEGMNAQIQRRLAVFRTARLSDDVSELLVDVCNTINNQKRPDRGNLTPLQLLALSPAERKLANDAAADRVELPEVFGLAPLFVGSTVRALRMTRKEQIQNKTKGFAAKWSKTVYTVSRKVALQKNNDHFRYYLEGSPGFFYRHELLKIPRKIDHEVPRGTVVHRQDVIGEEYDPAEDSEDYTGDD